MRNLILFSFIIGSLLIGCSSPESSYLTVEEVKSQRDTLIGQRVTIRGWTQYSILSTAVLCSPEICDCNDTRGELYLVTEPYDSLAIFDGILVQGLKCEGNDCGINCSPFEPAASYGQAYQLTGTLTDCGYGEGSQHICLDELDQNAMYILSGSDDLHSMTATLIEPTETTTDIRP